ncbi:MAG: tetratricopeptide repeat protein [Deinococcota bacterium]
MTLRLWFILLSCLLIPAVSAQRTPSLVTPNNIQNNVELGLSEAALEALDSGREAALEALDTYSEHYLNLPLWQDAMFHGQEAEGLAPGHPEPLRFLAEIYTITRWYAPAWEAWNAYITAGGTLDATALTYLTEAGNQLAYDYYNRGDLVTSASFYEQVIGIVPGGIEAYAALGQIYLDLGRPQDAVPFWQQVLNLNPNDSRASYFLTLASDQAIFGIEAANAFRNGVNHYNQGDMSSARDMFRNATTLNAEYAEAWAWLGRTAFEAGNYTGAADAYSEAVSLAPDNSTYIYFLQESRRLQH